MSSPRRKTRSSRSISSQSPCRIASSNVIDDIVFYNIDLVFSPNANRFWFRVIGVHTTNCILRGGCRLTFCPSQIFVKYFRDALVYLINFASAGYFVFPQQFFNVRDRIALMPLIKYFFCHIRLIIVRSVPAHPECFGFDEARSAALACTLYCTPGRVKNRGRIIAVYDLARYSISLHAIGKIQDSHLLCCRSRISVRVILTNDHQWQVLHCCKICSFMKRASAGCAVADVNHSDGLLPLHSPCEHHSIHHGYEGTQWANRSNETTLEIGDVDVLIASVRERCGSPEIVCEDLAGQGTHDK